MVREQPLRPMRNWCENDSLLGRPRGRGQCVAGKNWYCDEQLLERPGAEDDLEVRATCCLDDVVLVGGPSYICRGCGSCTTAGQTQRRRATLLVGTTGSVCARVCLYM